MSSESVFDENKDKDKDKDDGMNVYVRLDGDCILVSDYFQDRDGDFKAKVIVEQHPCLGDIGYYYGEGHPYLATLEWVCKL